MEHTDDRKAGGNGKAQMSSPDRPLTRLAVKLVLVVFLLALLILATISGALANKVVDRVWSLDFSPNAQYLAVMSSEGVTLYEPSGGTISIHVEHGRRVAFSPNSRRVAISTPLEIVIFDITTGDILDEYDTEGDWTTSVAFSPDGRLLASLAEDNNSLRLRDVDAGRLLWDVDAHEDADYAIAFSTDGELIATGGRKEGSRNHQIRLWDSDTGSLVKTFESDRHASVDEAYFLPDGGSLMIALSDGEPNLVWDISDLDEIHIAENHPLAGLQGPVVLAEGGGYIAAGVRTGDVWSQSVAVYHVETRHRVFQSEGKPGLRWGAAFLPTGSEVAFATSFGDVYVWDFTTGGLVRVSSGYRTPRKAVHWTALWSFSAIWLLCWVAFHIHALRREGQRRGYDWILVPVVALAASGLIVYLHWLQVADTPNIPNPLSALESMAAIESVCFLGLGLLTGLTRSWSALVVNLISFPALLVATANLWLALNASV